jgi:hypothetical protein
MTINRSGAPGSGVITKGKALTLTGRGFTPGRSVEAYFSDHPDPRLRGTSTTIGVANSSGSVSVTLPTNNWRLGRYSASLRQPGKVSNTGWLVLSDARHSASLSSSSLFQGDRVTLYARYYAPSEALYLLWTKHPYDTNKTLRIGTTDVNGHATVSFNTSAWAPGIYSANVFTADSHGGSHLSSAPDVIGTTLVSPTTTVTVGPCAPGTSPCELQGVSVTVSGRGFVHNSSVVARWKSHPVATSVGTTEMIGFSDGSGALNAQLSSTGWAPGTYVAEVYSTTNGRRNSHIATVSMSVIGPSIAIDECNGNGPHEGTGQSDSGPCAIDRSVFHLRGTRFPPDSEIVARWTVHPVSTSVGSVDRLGTAAANGSLSANIDSRPWAPGLYKAEIYAQSGGKPVSSIVRMALLITPTADISLQGCRSQGPLDETGRCYVKRGHPISLYNPKGGFGHNEQLVIEWQEVPDDYINKSLTLPIGIADSSGFTIDFATTTLNLGEYKARIYSVDRNGYRSSSIVEKTLAIENPDLAYHGYMSIDKLTQEKITEEKLTGEKKIKFSRDAEDMHCRALDNNNEEICSVLENNKERVLANAVLFNPSNSDVPHEYSWNKELEKTKANGMTAFIGISDIFFEPGQEIEQNDDDCIVEVKDKDGAAEAEWLYAVFFRSPSSTPSSKDFKIPADTQVYTIPAGTRVYTTANEVFRTLSETIFAPEKPSVKVRVVPDDATARLPNHVTTRFIGFDKPNNGTFDTTIKLKTDCLETPRYDLDLRSDWKTRWAEFQKANGDYLGNSEIKAGFHLDEPLWNQITNRELSTFVDAVKTAYPNRPLIVVEAAKEWLLDSIALPEGVDWFGFDKYEESPSTDLDYKKLIDKTQALIAPHDHMKMIIVGDAFNYPKYAQEYYDLARYTERVVALGWYAWSLNDRGIGGKGLMEHVKGNLDLRCIHEDIGEAIAGSVSKDKCIPRSEQL